MIENNNEISMKIGIVSPTYNVFGGGQIYIEKLNEYFNGMNVQSFIYSADELINSSVLIERIDGWPRLVRNVYKVAEKLKKDGVTHVVLNDINLSMLSFVFSFFGIKVFPLIHMEIENTSSDNLIVKSFLPKVRSFFVNFKSDVIFNVNKSNEVFLRKDKTVFTPNFISSVEDVGGVEEDLNRQYDLIFVGRLDVEKQVDRLIEFILFAKKNKNKIFKLLIVGDGALKEKLILHVKKMMLENEIDFAGHVPYSKVGELYCKAKVLVLSSKTEGFPTVCLEAAKKKVPSILPMVGSCVYLSENYKNIKVVDFDFASRKAEDVYEECFTKIDELINLEISCSEYSNFLKDFSLNNVGDVFLRNLMDA